MTFLDVSYPSKIVESHDKLFRQLDGFLSNPAYFRFYNRVYSVLYRRLGLSLESSFNNELRRQFWFQLGAHL